MMDKKEFLSNHYLEVSETDKSWGLYVISSGLAVLGTKEECPRLYRPAHLSLNGHVYDCYNIVYIKSGSMLFFPELSSEESIAAKEGEIILAVPGIRHRYHANPDTGVEECWIKFDGYHARKLQENGVLPSDTTLFKTGEHSVSVNDFANVHNIVNDVGNLDVQRKILPFLMSILSSLSPSPHEIAVPVVEEARLFMLRNVERNLRFTDFAIKHGMTPRNFRRVFKNATGQSPLQYFLTIKMNRAKALLESRRHSVKEVATMLGFDDQYYFSRIFKRKTGVPPSAWK